jgi:hypothetical protein
MQKKDVFFTPTLDSDEEFDMNENVGREAAHDRVKNPFSAKE